MHEYADILGPLVLTLNLFIAAYPIQTFLMRRGVPRVLAQVVLAIVVFAILLTFFYALVWSITSLVQELPQYQRQFWNLYHQCVSLLGQFGVSEQQVLDQVKTINPANFAGVLTSAVGSVTNIITLLTVIIVMIFMMAFDTDAFGERNESLQRYQPRIWHSIADFIAGVRRYWVVSSVFGLIVAVIDVVALELLNVPLALVWGILAFLTNYIPNVGFVIGLVPPAIMALLANDPLTALLVVIIYSVVKLRDPVDHPAQVQRRRGRRHRLGVVPVVAAVEFGDGRPGSATGPAHDAAGQGIAGRPRPADALAQRVHFQ